MSFLKQKLIFKYTPCIVYSTFPSRDSAKKIIDFLLDEKLIACANVFPEIHSSYRWKEKSGSSKIYQDKEISVYFKTQKKHIPKLKKVILQKHPYEVPCLLHWKIKILNQSYRDWFLNHLK